MLKEFFSDLKKGFINWKLRMFQKNMLARQKYKDQYEKGMKEFKDATKDENGKSKSPSSSTDSSSKDSK